MRDVLASVTYLRGVAANSAPDDAADGVLGTSRIAELAIVGPASLSPPFDFRRLVAHMLFGPVIADEDHQPPPPRIGLSYDSRRARGHPAAELMDQCS